MTPQLRLAILGSAVLLMPASAAAQLRVPDDVTLRLSGRLHAQFNTTSVDAEPASEFLVRRARLTLEIGVGKYLSGKIEPDFGEGELDLKDAWARLELHPAFNIQAGQFKRPFDLFELTSSTRILVVERAGGIRGVGACAGPGGVCSFSRLTEGLEFSDRDIGVLIDGRQGSVSWTAAITNGTGSNTADENGNKSYSGRVAIAVRPHLTVAVNGALHDYVHPTSGVDRYAHAVGADVEYGSFAGGPHVQAGFVTGENWRNPTGPQDGSTFLAAQAIATYRANLSEGPVTGIEPLVRVSYGDPDTDTDADHGWLLTPGLNIHFLTRNRLALNIDYWSPDTGDAEWSFKGQMFFYF